MRITDLTALELGKKIRAERDFRCGSRPGIPGQIKAAEETIHAYVTVDERRCITSRQRRCRNRSRHGMLTGPAGRRVLAAIKDNMCTEGLKTTCSSKILYNFVPTYTAEAVKNLEKAGAVVHWKDQHG